MWGGCSEDAMADSSAKKRKADDESWREIPAPQQDMPKCISLTTHDGHFGPAPLHMKWGAEDPLERGPVLATVRHPNQRNAIGAHSGA
jgi:hypothetical protein